MNKVLLPLAVNTDEKGQVAYFARPTYIQALERVNLEPVLVTVEFTENQLREAYESCGGVLFMGGWDVDPRYYSQVAHDRTRTGEPNRDKLEMMILTWVLRDKKPYLGICRGEQILNVVCGGTLLQHLPDLVEEEHSVGAYEHLGDVKHKVVIEKESQLFQIVGREEMEVNSGHHQASDKLGDGLKVVARSPYGVIEAIEGLDNKQFLLGVQWHPEAEKSENSERIFKAFAKAIAEAC